MPSLTKSGQPRKRKEGAGRKPEGRTANLPRIKPEAHAKLVKLAKGSTVAATIERLITQEASR